MTPYSHHKHHLRPQIPKPSLCISNTKTKALYFKYKRIHNPRNHQTSTTKLNSPSQNTRTSINNQLKNQSNQKLGFKQKKRKPDPNTVFYQ